MARYRSFLSFVLGCLLIVLTTLSAPALAAKKAAPTYTPSQLEQIESYQSAVHALSDRFPEVVPMIEKRQWTDVRDFIHGPLGELRQRMSRLTRNLLPQDQAAATAATKEIFKHFVELDEAAAAQDYAKTVRAYGEALKDVNAFFTALPKG